jgi:NAD(P) transhydrogenase
MVEPRDSILGFVEHEIRAKLISAMNNAGIRILTQSTVKAVIPPSSEQHEHPINVELENGKTLSASHVLYATGRTGCTEHLGLEIIGVEPNHRGYISVNKHYQTNCPNVYAAGDVIGFPALASTSMEQGRVAACHMFDIDYKKQLSHILPIGLYTIPPIATVGLTEEEARGKKIDVMVGRAPMGITARGRMLEADEATATGLAKIVFEYPSRRIIGVQIIGPEAIELIHIGQMAIRSIDDFTQNETIDRFVHAVFNYPSLSEVYRLAAINGLQNIALRENRTDQIPAKAKVA